jgi:cytochrome P450
MSDIEAAALSGVLFLDGFETTSLALHHALYEIGKHKEIQTKLRNEILDNIEVEHLNYDQLIGLPYLNQVFYETLRLHPPLLFTSRVASEDVEIEDFKDHKLIIKKDSSIWIPIVSIHRDPGE